LRREQHDDAEIESLLDLGADDLPLRIASYRSPTHARPLLRPPSPVVAIHLFGTERLIMVIRCTTVLLFLQGDSLAVMVPASGLTASALTPDSELLLTGHADGTVTFWNAQTGEVTERFAAHRTAVTHVLTTFGAAYSCGADGSIIRWQRNGNEWRQTALRGQAGITSAAASYTGEYLAIGCANGDILVLAGTSTTLHTRAHDGAVTGLALRHNDGTLVSAGADRMLRACLPEVPNTAVKIASEHTHGVTGLAASPRGESFATYSPDRSIRLWSVDATSTKPEIQAVNVFTEHEAAVTSVYFGQLNDLELLVSGSADGELVVRVAGSAIARLHIHDGPVRAFALLPNNTLLTGGDDARLEWWRVKGNAVRRVPPDGVTSLSSGRGLVASCRSGLFRAEGAFTANDKGVMAVVHPDAQRVVVGPDSFEVCEYDASGQGWILTLESPIIAAFYANNTAHVALENGTLVEVSTQRRVTDGSESRLTSVLGEGGDPYILTGHANGDVMLVPTPSLSLAPSRVGSHAAPVTVLACHSDGVPVASAAADGSVIVWDTVDQPGPRFRGKHDGRVRHLAFLSDTTLASAGDDRLLILWNYRIGERIATCAGHRDIITALLYDERSGLLYTASLDATIRAWDLEGRQRGIVYGTHPFTTLARIQGDVLPGAVVAGDDAGALWTLEHMIDRHGPP
jgi:WD40 repeat protein